MGQVQLSLSVSPTLLGLRPQQQPALGGATAVERAGHGAGEGWQVSSTVEDFTTAAAGQADVVEVVREDWLVCNQLGGGAARAMAVDAWRREKVKMVPWVGVAAHLATHVSVCGYSSGGRSLSCRSSTAGRAFCFLPLPADTCLPVYINGYFELSSNRYADACL
jgi:hypothetical protein